jgi:hypothetical protein
MPASCIRPFIYLVITPVALLALWLGGCERVSEPPQALAVERAADVPPGLAAEWPNTDFSQRTVELDEIQSGGPPKDGIPAIDQPRFISTGAAGTWLNNDEPVIVVRIDDDARAYPLQILMYHEIVNDRVGGLPVAVTFCPLCNASIVFERELDGVTLDFGTTGRLRMSDLVMYDRQTESWWQQFTGKGIIGRYAGTELTEVRSQITSFADFRAAYPAGKVLSRATGFSRPYGHNPYRGYDNINQTPFLLDDPADPRLPPMERVLGISVGEQHRVHPFSELERHPVINSEFVGVPYVVFTKDGVRSALDAGQIAESRTVPAAVAFRRSGVEGVYTFTVRDGRIFDEQTGSEWNLFGESVAGSRAGEKLDPVPGGVHFAFAWLAFRPDTEVSRLP